MTIATGTFIVALVMAHIRKSYRAKRIFRLDLQLALIGVLVFALAVAVVILR
jgi:hypothetical protein